MLNVSEVTGAWTIPFGIDLGNTLWETINQTGLWLIPFTLTLISTWVRARSSGEDDGSSAVMFIKMLEKSWISMLFCVLVFVIPVDESTYVPDDYTADGVTSSFSKINFKAYSCRGDYSTILDTSSTSSNISPNLAYTLSLDTNLPLLMGLSNQMLQGFTQALNAKIPCDSDMNAAYLMAESATFSANGDSDVEYSAKQFVNQCYLPAMRNLATSIGNGYYNEGAPLSIEQRWFNSAELIAAYSGNVPIDSSDNYSVGYMPYDSTQWAGTGGGDDLVVTSDEDSDATEDKILSCNSAQTQIFSVIAGDGGVFDEHYSELITKAKTTEKAYPDKDGDYKTTTDILTKYAHQFLMDITGNTAGIFNINHSAAALVKQQRESDLFGDVISRTTTLFTELNNNISNFTASIGGGILISAIIGILFAVSPVILTLSGYSLKVASGLVFTLAFLIGSSYVLDVAWYLQNVIIVLASSSYSIYITDPALVNGDVPVDMLSMISFVQSAIPITAMAIWSFLGGILGVMVIPALSQMLNTFSTSVGDAGTKVAKMMIQLAVKTISKKM